MTYLPVKSNGLIDIDQLEATITPATSLVSIMTVNNEIGVRQPVEQIGAICRQIRIHIIIRRQIKYSYFIYIRIIILFLTERKRFFFIPMQLKLLERYRSTLMQ